MLVHSLLFTPEEAIHVRAANSSCQAVLAHGEEIFA